MCVLIVFGLFYARVLWAVPVYGGCGGHRGTARETLAGTGIVLLVVPVLWFGARRSPWAVRLVRSSFALAVMAWVYVRWTLYGLRPPWYW